MASAPAPVLAPEAARRARTRVLGDPPAVRLALIGLGACAILLLVVLPVLSVFAQALEKGLGAYANALTRPETLSAIKLTLLVAIIVVPANTIFGCAAAWLLGKYLFPGRAAILSLVDVPFSVSPVVSGLVFVLLCGSRGVFGSWLGAHDVKIIFALPGIVLATAFVTLPFVVREVLPLMQAQGSDEEEAALTLGASGWRIFWRVTLPKIRWGLLYGVILCNARAMGEFGAVSVVSGHIRGATNTLPLEVEILYNEYDFVGAFAAASLLTLLAAGTLVLKRIAGALERRRHGGALAAGEIR